MRLGFGEGVASVNARPHHAALLIAVDIDVAQSLGGILKEELNLVQEVIVVDGIEVGDLHYLDIGRPAGMSKAVPVSVKTWRFNL